MPHHHYSHICAYYEHMRDRFCYYSEMRKMITQIVITYMILSGEF